MSRKDSTIQGILALKCPYCGEGEFFVSHPYDLRRIGDVHDYCPKCKGRLNPEPGFYLGVLMVSNVIGIALGMAVWAAFILLAPEADALWIVVTVMAALLLAWPWIYAVSKVIWAHLFLNFDNPTGLKRREEEH
ncbi:MAG TPA: DUF983 domain-containing protein [Flavobacteriales bacterium]|nr:DUF983 domain-containing protein [Flavobacteriales bacterium]